MDTHPALSTDDAISICVNRAVRPIVRNIGKENTPIIIIDDFAVSIADIKDYACQTDNFEAVSKRDSYYPGVRLKLPKQYVVDVISPINRLIQQTYHVPSHLNIAPTNFVYSLVSTPASQLSTLQRIPHFDTSHPYYFAVLHYLADGEHGNTAFFRHKPTQFERISEERKTRYFESAQQFFNENGKPSAQYCTSSTDHFEIYDQIEYRPNRLAIYPGNLLHSILINEQTDICANPKQGRLTANIFVVYR